ncbi:MAG TPA: Fe-S protein assembly co-chaperone HscB [Phycisphaerae bacterium]|nr:Fe-S protein assembly co-chaperone HscB [Phycisphaerae bacterium]
MTRMETVAVPTKCNTCEALAQTPLVCQDCHQLLAHVQGADYFELFGLPRGYDIDARDLGSRYLSISRNIHPDKFAIGDPSMQAFALRASAAVNRAYEVLGDPRHRAEYLLETAGGQSAAQDKRVPTDFLSRVMLLREEIEDAKAGGDTATLDTLQGQVSRERGETEARIAKLCAALPGGSPDTRDELRQQLNALKYLDNLLMQFAPTPAGETR